MTIARIQSLHTALSLGLQQSSSCISETWETVPNQPCCGVPQFMEARCTVVKWGAKNNSLWLTHVKWNLRRPAISTRVTYLETPFREYTILIFLHEHTKAKSENGDFPGDQCEWQCFRQLRGVLARSMSSVRYKNMLLMHQTKECTTVALLS